VINLPFIFRFICFLRSVQKINSIKSVKLREIANLLTGQIQYYSFEKIEALRYELKSGKGKISTTDMGAGTNLPSKRIRSVAYITKTSSSSRQQCQGLFRLVNALNIRKIIELGTSLGISASYLASVDSKNVLNTIEGDPEIAKIAVKNFKKLGLNNVSLTLGNFDESIDAVLQKYDSIDMAFIDGNHRKEPTLVYFEKVMQKCNPEAVLVFDDIYWSDKMHEAWKQIIADKRVSASLDLFTFGLVFLSKNFEGHHRIFKPNIINSLSLALSK
jgi:predicted O-methyltransferase YrrM